MKNQKGFSLVELLVVVIIIAIIAAIAIPSLLASRRAANEASAVQSMRTYHSAQSTYQATNVNKNYATQASDLGSLVDNILNGTTSPTLQKSGYQLAMIGVPASTGVETSYCAEASPLNAGSGTNHYGVSSGNGGVVVANTVDTNCTSAGTLGTGGTPVQ